MNNIIGQTLSKYQIEDRVGQGGMSSVYRAFHKSLNRHVAVKILHRHLSDEEDFITRFEQEAANIATLRHPNIVQVFDFDHDKDQYFMVMELVNGPTLKEELATRDEQNRPFNFNEIARIFHPLANAVEYAHQNGIIHRDIKPANIMFTAAGEVVLTDFGLARLLGDMRVSMAGMIAGTPAYMSPEQAQGHGGDERTDIYALGLILYEMCTGRSPFKADVPQMLILQHMTELPPNPADFRPEMSLELEEVILKAIEKRPQDRYQSAAEMAAEMLHAIGMTTADLLVDTDMSIASRRATVTGIYTSARIAQKLPIGDCPYRGLYAFREEDAEFFFGREKFTAALATGIRHHTINALIGPSGSGKSSVVSAGLVPYLRQSGPWQFITVRPGPRPFNALAAQLTPLLEPELSGLDAQLQAQKLARALRDHDISLHDVIQRLQSKNGVENGRVLLIIDQFEELYTLTESDKERQKFLRQLIALAPNQLSDIQPRHNIIATLRADFLAQVLDYRPFTDRLHTVMLGPMTREELTQAVELPARKQNATFEDGLVERILDDVGEEPGNLPLLEFALTSLWNRHDEDGYLTHAAYEEIGRVEGALARHAEQTFTALSTEEQARARQIFIQLVRPGEGTEDTRRIATVDEIGEPNWPLVQTLADARLVITNQEPTTGVNTAEVVHEALIRGWSRLQRWMDDNRSFRAWQERLRQNLKQWQETDQDEGALLRGAQLAAAQEWLAERPHAITAPEQAYIEAGSTAHRREQQTREQEARTRARLGRALTIVSLVGFVITLGLAVWSINQRNAAVTASVEADAQRRTAESASGIAERQRIIAETARATAVAERGLLQDTVSQQLAIQADIARPQQHDLSLLLAIEAYRTRRTVDARSSLLNGLTDRPALRHYLPAHSDRVQDVAVHPTGRLAATAGADGNIFIWDVATGRQVGLPLVGHGSIVNDVAFSPDGETLASSSNDRLLILWDLTTAPPTPQPLIDHNAFLFALAFSPDGRMLATGGADGSIVLWDVETRTPIGDPLVNGHTDAVNALTFVPGGRFLVSGGNDGRIIFWDAALGTISQQPLRTQSPINTLAVSVDGQFLAAGNRENRLQLWNVNGRTLHAEIVAHDSWVTAAAFHPQRGFIAGGGRDGQIRYWQVEDLAPIDYPFTAQGDWVSHLAFTPDGTTLVSSSYDEQAVVWQAPTAATLNKLLPAVGRPFRKHTNWVLDGAPHPTNGTVATGDRDGRVFVWHTDGMTVSQTITVPAPVRTVAYSPDGSTLALGTETGQVLLWSQADSRLTPLLGDGHTDFVQTITFSPDGRLLATGGDDERVVLWDVARQTAVGRMTGHNGTVWEVAFAPDGNTLYSAGRDGTVRRWNPTTRQAVGEPFQAHSLPVRGLAVSSDGRLLATAGDDETAVIWDTTTWEPLHTLSGHTSELNDVAFSPTDQRIATAGNDTHVILWDVETGREIGRLSGHGERVYTVNFTADERQLLTTGRDGLAVVWNVDPGRWEALACEQVNRSLTDDEWQRFFGNRPYTPTCPRQ